MPTSTRSSIGFGLAAVAAVVVLSLARPDRLAAEKCQAGTECGGGGGGSSCVAIQLISCGRVYDYNRCVRWHMETSYPYNLVCVEWAYTETFRGGHL